MTTENDGHAISPGDAELLLVLGRALDTVEPLPTHARALAYAAHLMADFEAELAQLVFDSDLSYEVAFRRGAENEARLLSFSNDHLTLEVSLAADGATIVGEIYPVAAERLIVERREGEVVDVALDAFGRFRISCAASSFRVRVPGHLVTPWIDRQ